MNKFGFIVHCRDKIELRKALIRYRFSPLSFMPEKTLMAACLKKCFVQDTFTFHEITSDANKTCQGKSFCIFMTPEQMLENQGLATELVKKACTMAEEWGAKMIGLGAATAIVGSRGLAVAESTSVSVTTGNSLTVYAAIIGLEKIAQKLNLDLSKHKIVIIGLPGSIALALTKILHAKGLDLVLVNRRTSSFLKRFLETLEPNNATIEVTQDLEDAIKKGQIIFSATSTGNIIDPLLLPKGSIVFDIAQPRDVIYRKNYSDDILIIDSGTIRLPKSTQTSYKWAGWGVNNIPACLGETITLTLENQMENFSIGRELHTDKIQKIGELSEKHGFIFDEFRSFTKLISEENLENTKRALEASL
ncbi:MAG: hypothetical protein ACUZ8E_02050 [Candidatus Anammoxibacter sp.]